VLNSVNADDGRVRLHGAEWSARTTDRDLVLPPGTVVRVVQIDGATAVVGVDPQLGYADDRA
jgi:membrane protein implicated in regulation of membrane protease activity